jgi:hypothetical protein
MPTASKTIIINNHKPAALARTLRVFPNCTFCLTFSYFPLFLMGLDIWITLNLVWAAIKLNSGR